MKKCIPRILLVIAVILVTLTACSKEDDFSAPKLENTTQTQIDVVGEIIELNDTDDEIEFTVYCEEMNIRSTFTKIKSKLPEDSPILTYKVGDPVELICTTWGYEGTGLVARQTLTLK